VPNVNAGPEQIERRERGDELHHRRRIHRLGGVVVDQRRAAFHRGHDSGNCGWRNTRAREGVANRLGQLARRGRRQGQQQGEDHGGAPHFPRRSTISRAASTSSVNSASPAT
jgi:hypothetical protein